MFSGSDGSLLHSFLGPAYGSWFGWSVGSVGDMDLDGFDDVIVGAPFYQTIIVPTQPGQVQVRSGATGAILHAISGPGGFDRSGYAVGGAGDLDGDGVPDFYVGAPDSFSSLSSVGEGWVRVYSGASGAPVVTFLPTINCDVRVGWSVDRIGDVNGDGKEDFVVGAPCSYPPPFPGLTGEGRAFIYSGSDGSVLRTFDGTVVRESLGYSVSSAGDVDGDGVTEVAFGTNPYFNACAPGGPGPAPQPGRVLVYSASGGTPLFVLNGTLGGERFGFAVDGGEDVSGDGIPDLLVGIPTGSVPPVYVVGLVKVFSLVGIPAGVTEVGTGCTGTGGYAPKMATHGGLPAVGNANFGCSVARGLGGTVGALFAGTSLNPAGIPVAGCDVYLAGAVLWFVPLATLGGTPGTPGGGHRLVKVGIPSDPVLVGGAVHFQWAALDPGSANGLFVTSNALTVTIQ